MRTSTRPVVRLGMALTAALLGLATVTATAIATADPSEPPSSSETAPSEPTSPSSSDSPTETTPPPSESPPDSSPPDSAPPKAESLDDVTATATFGKPSYVTGETMTISLTLKNNGTEPLRLVASFPFGKTPDGIVVTGTTTFPKDQWFDLAAGESVTNELTGVAVNPAVDTGTLNLQLSIDGAHRSFAFTVPVAPRTTHVTGTVYDDMNGNGHHDSGEGVSDVTLTWDHPLNEFYKPKATTNAAGEYAIDVSPGSYRVRGQTYGYLVGERHVDVTGSTMAGVDLQARPVLSKLDVDVSFTHDTYRPDESPTVRVVLTNNGDRPMTGIAAYCWPGEPNITVNDHWGDLGGDGVDLAPHGSRSFSVTEPMPAKAYDYGYVAADCQFGYAGMAADSGNPRDTAYATVPGQFVNLSGQFRTASGDGGLSGFQVTLTGPDGTCPIIATVTTGPDGKFTIKHLPAGRYLVFAVPPPGWDYELSWTPPFSMTLVAGKEHTLSYLAYRSPTTAATRPPDCPGGGGGGTGPVAQGGTTPGLAYTGASLVLPGVAGLLALLTGAGALLLANRRRRGTPA